MGSVQIDIIKSFTEKMVLRYSSLVYQELTFSEKESYKKKGLPAPIDLLDTLPRHTLQNRLTPEVPLPLRAERKVVQNNKRISWADQISSGETEKPSNSPALTESKVTPLAASSYDARNIPNQS